MKPIGLVFCVAVIAFTAALSSCAPEGHVPTGPAAENLRQLAVGYMQFMAQHGGRTPNSEEDFRKYLAKSRRDSSAVDDLFVSPRDNLPYRVKYGIVVTGAEPVVVAWEQDGVGGQLVAFDFGSVEVVDDAQLEELIDGNPQ